MTDNKFDDLFRKKFSAEEQPEFDPQHWQAAREMLVPGNDVKRPAVPWIYFLVGLLAVGVLGYLLWPANGTPVLGELPITTDVMEAVSEPGETSPDKMMATVEEISRKDKVSPVRTDTKGEVQTSDLPLHSEPSIVSSSMIKTSQVKQNEAAGTSTPDAGMERTPIVDGRMKPNRDDRTSQYKNLQLIPSMPLDDLSFHYSLAEVNKSISLPIVVDNHISMRYGFTTGFQFGTQDGRQVFDGIGLGVVAEMRVNPWFYLGARPSFQGRVNQQSLSKFRQSVSYSFTAVDEIYGLEASSLYFVQLPLYVGLGKGRHTIETGLILDWLVAARGVLQEFDYENQHVEVVRELSEGWIETNDMNTLIPGAFAGYRFWWSTHLNVGINVKYQIEDIYPTLPQSVPYANGSKWYWGVQGTYYFK